MSIATESYYGVVPKGRVENIEYRRWVLELARGSEEHRKNLRAMCARDILFFVNTFAFTYDPRLLESPVVPFITYEYQDDALRSIHHAVSEGHDLAIEKSRDMGATWMVLMDFYWRWHFKEYQSFLVASRKEDLVDSRDDPDCLFAKMDLVWKMEPGWLRPLRDRTACHMLNVETRSTIDGTSTTGDMARGGRRTAMLLDEFAAVPEGSEVLGATGSTSNCRVFNSTPKGTTNAFYDVIRTTQSKITLHWSLHPDKGRGLYVQDGKKRSPWYDAECKRYPTPALIAQELDIDYLGAGYQYFDPVMLDGIEKESVQAPMVRGEMFFDPVTAEPKEFIRRKDKGSSSGRTGRVHFWMPLDEKGKPPLDRNYVIGVDVATGTGASNSALSIGDAKTGEKVGEFVTPDMRPTQFARYAVALARWLAPPQSPGAFLIWESNGPGRNFGDVVMELGYRNVYWRKREESVAPKASDVPGWHTTPANKLALLGAYREALVYNRFVNRSHEAIVDARQYIFTQDGAVGHAEATVRKDDPSGARANHADRVVADALCWWGMKNLSPVQQAVIRIPKGSLADIIERSKGGRRDNGLW